MKGKSLFLLFTLVCSIEVLACSEDDLIEEGSKQSFDRGENGLNEQQVNIWVDKVRKVYSPIFKEHNIALEINHLWWNDQINAATHKAGIPKGSLQIINICGGLTRHKEVSPDVIVMILCHEIGHRLGGHPELRHGHFTKIPEGQADYFASLRCFKKVMQNEDNTLYMKDKSIPHTLARTCEQVYESRHDSDLCQRNMLAAYQTMVYVSSTQPELRRPLFQLGHEVVVNHTLVQHPDLQCRLESHLRGALCHKDLKGPLNPENPLDPKQCHGLLGEELGARPACWYKENVEF